MAGSNVMSRVLVNEETQLLNTRPVIHSPRKLCVEYFIVLSGIFTNSENNLLTMIFDGIGFQFIIQELSIRSFF